MLFECEQPFVGRTQRTAARETTLIWINLKILFSPVWPLVHTEWRHHRQQTFQKKINNACWAVNHEGSKTEFFGNVDLNRFLY